MEPNNLRLDNEIRHHPNEHAAREARHTKRPFHLPQKAVSHDRRLPYSYDTLRNRGMEMIHGKVYDISCGLRVQGFEVQFEAPSSRDDPGGLWRLVALDVRS